MTHATCVPPGQGDSRQGSHLKKAIPLSNGDGSVNVASSDSIVEKLQPGQNKEDWAAQQIQTFFRAHLVSFRPSILTLKCSDWCNMQQDILATLSCAPNDFRQPCCFSKGCAYICMLRVPSEIACSMQGVDMDPFLLLASL